MDNISERQALLVQDPTPRRLRVNNYHRGDGGCSSDDQSASGSGSDDWWGGSGSETGSSSSSFCSGSEDSELEWESEVTERGELFYVESNVRVEREIVEEVAMGLPVDTEQTLAPVPRKRHSTKAKLVRLIRRRNSRRQRSKAATAVLSGLSTATTTVQETSEGTNIRSTVANKVTFQDWQEGEAREVTFNVDPCAPHNLGRRATLTETLLGVVTAAFADGLRIMVSGFVPQGEAMKHRGVKIGDWLRSVDGQEVTIQTMESVLATVTTPRKVILTLQRVTGCEVTTDETLLDSQQKRIYQSPLVQHMVGNIGPVHREELATLFHGRPIGVLYLALEGLSESGPPDQEVIFCYPSPLASNPLGAARGSFLTLHHLVPEVATTPPVSSTCLLKGELMHVTYTAQPGGELLLLALPDSRCQLHEALSLTADVVRNLQFSHQTLHRCFSDAGNRPELDHQFCLFFTRLLAGGLLPSPPGPAPPLLFEDTLLAARWLPLPRETQAQLDEALSELEASDFGDVNDDLNGYQRLFTITGSCLFHKGYLLSSHLQHADLVDVVSFCRQHGLLELGRREAVRSLVLWRRVYLASCERGLQTVQTAISPYRLPDGKWFLLIVGKGHDMLVVLLESGGCTIRSEGDCGPDVVYVEQVQDTLLRVQKLGIVSVAARWLNKCARPQPCQPEQIALQKVASPGFLGLTPTKLTGTVVSMASTSPNVSSRKVPEVTSILKRRGPSPERSPITGLLSDRSPNLSGLSLCSEDSASRTASLAESDEAPILGRRAERERERLSDSDSESDCYRSDGQNFDSERRQSQSVLAGLENILSSKLTAGEENVMFHYVHLDLTEGILMCPPPHRDGYAQPQRMTEILHHFRLSAQVIHTLLQNTVQFKKLAGHEVSKTRVNKSLVAIKEHGVLFECSAGDLENTKKTQPFTYWVIGRLFFTPQPREVYVCHHDSAPQNMVEIAFRLGLSTAG